jgi:hypothetical protein
MWWPVIDATTELASATDPPSGAPQIADAIPSLAVKCLGPQAPALLMAA